MYVAYRTDDLDLDWIPESDGVVVVHNDRALDPARCRHPNVRHIFSPENVGFGAAVNAALPEVQTSRVVLVNPDTTLQRRHWNELAAGPPDDVRTVPLVDGSGAPTSVVSRYPTGASLLLTAWRVGRLVPRGSSARRVLSRGLGRWGHAHGELMRDPVGCWPLREMWVSGAVLSVATDRIRAVDGFDEDYFLYLEDADLCRRLAALFPAMQARVLDLFPGVHGVGASGGDGSRAVDLHYARSCRRWASGEQGARWRAIAAGVALRERWLAR